MSENYDKSTYLTKVRRIQGRDFESYSKRNQEIIKQGGNDQFLDIIKDGARSQEFYDQMQKEKNLMQRLDKNCLNFAGYEKRNMIGGIYKRDYDKPTDPYDLGKVDQGKLKTTKNSGKSALVEMKRQEKRDVTKMYKQSVGESYANIQRENDKADYIKRLLM